jgi:hypothetical protein
MSVGRLGSILNLLMTAITIWRGFGLLTTAEPGFAVLLWLKTKRLDTRALVRTVTEGLTGRTPTCAPPILFTSVKIHIYGLLRGDYRFIHIMLLIVGLRSNSPLGRCLEV